MKIFNTVQDLKEARLTAGQLTETKGYHSSGDGGQARYLIQTSAEFGGVPDGDRDFELANGNVAVREFSSSFTLKSPSGVLHEVSVSDAGVIVVSPI